MSDYMTNLQTGGEFCMKNTAGPFTVEGGVPKSIRVKPGSVSVPNARSLNQRS